MSESPQSVFPTVKQSVLDRAVELTLKVLDDPRTPNRVAQYYDPETDNAGHSFLSLKPNTPNQITPTDLMAITMLNIRQLPASAIRRILDHPEHREHLTTTLQNLPDARLEETTPEHFYLMGRFYDTLKPLLSGAKSKTSNKWVTASKLAARKRPDLFPVRDYVVCNYLGILDQNDATKDWYVFRHLMQNPHIQQQLSGLPAEAAQSATGHRPILDPHPLRLLDAALWMYAI